MIKPVSNNTSAQRARLSSCQTTWKLTLKLALKLAGAAITWWASTLLTFPVSRKLPPLHRSAEESPFLSPVRQTEPYRVSTRIYRRLNTHTSVATLGCDGKASSYVDVFESAGFPPAILVLAYQRGRCSDARARLSNRKWDISQGGGTRARKEIWEILSPHRPVTEKQNLLQQRRWENIFFTIKNSTFWIL